MPSDRQIEANRRNAQKSTGPRTEAGKEKSRINAIRHGLTGHLELTPDPAREAFIAEMIDSFKPADLLERQLAHSIADAYWRINRISNVETSLIASDSDDDILRTMNLLTTYEMRLHRKIQSDLRQLRQLQSARRADEAGRAGQEAAASRLVFDEACALLELKLRQNNQIDLDGEFTHPNGFVFSNRKLLQAITLNRRIERAKCNLAQDPFSVPELERILRPQPSPSTN